MRNLNLFAKGSLRVRFMVMFCSVTIVITLSLGITSYKLMANHVEGNQRLHLVERAQIAASEFDRSINDKKSLLIQISKAREVQDFPITYRHPLLARHLAEFQDDFLSIGFIDANGNEELLIEDGHTSEVTATFSTDQSFLKAKKSPGTIIVTQHPSLNTITFTLGMKNYFGDVFLGCLRAVVSLEKTTSHFRETLVGRTGFLGLVNDKGILFKGKDSPTENDTLEKKQLPIGVIPNGFTEIEYPTGERFLSGFAATSIKSWHIAALLPYDEFLAGPNHLAVTFLGFGVVFLVVGSLVIIYLSSQLSVPLSRLVGATREIAAGHWDKIDLYEAPGEIGDLVAAFNSMTKELKETTVSRDFLDNILESMRESIIVTDLHGRIERVNRATCSMLDYPSAELIGEPITLLLTGIQCNSDHWIDQITRSSGQFTQRSYRNKNGREIPVFFSWARFSDAAGKTNGMVCIAQLQDSGHRHADSRNRVRTSNSQIAS
jgi:PAS domain S-box-containing protein